MNLSLKDLDRLKKTLDNIDSIHKNNPILENQVSELEVKITNNKKDLAGYRRELAKIKKLQEEHEDWLEVKHAKIKHNLEQQKKAEEKLERFAEEEKPGLENAIGQLKILEETSHGFFLIFCSIITLIVFTSVGVYTGYQQADEIPRGEWI